MRVLWRTRLVDEAPNLSNNEKLPTTKKSQQQKIPREVSHWGFVMAE